MKDRDRFPHAVALVGSQESAVTEALSLAKALLCEEKSAPCGTCGSCVRVDNRNSEAVLWVEPESGGMIKLEAAHKIRDFLSLTRVRRARVVIVNEAQALNPQATNALLKAVEEPPPSTYFMFLTPDVNLFTPTLRSRLQVIRLPRAPHQWTAEDETVREDGEAFLSACWSRDRAAMSQVLENRKDRESALEFARALAWILRDWSMGETAYENWPELEPRTKVEFWRWAHQAEVDLNGHVDRNLVFENLFYRISTHGLD